MSTTLEIGYYFPGVLISFFLIPTPLYAFFEAIDLQRSLMQEVRLSFENKLFPARESLVSDITAGDGKTAYLFLQCISIKFINALQGW